MANIRSVIHIHILSFCAALEQIRKPELARKPVMITHVSGNIEFVISASPEARAQGVYDGITARHAGRYCPDGIFLPVD
ncbi:MAG TPA: DNA polymerase IV, partial [Armatimonadota bacterium]